MESQTCNFCKGKIRRNHKTDYNKSVDDYEQMKKDMEEIRSLLELKEQEISELKKLNIHLNDQILRRGSILIREENVDNAKLNFKNACLKHKIRLSYDHKGSRIRFSFKSDTNKKYYRVNFKLAFSPTIALQNDADKIIEKIKEFLNGIFFERQTNDFLCEIKYEEGEYLIYY
jgi:hypothetical protein